MNKIIHIVGGGFNQIPLVKQAKEMGHKVLVTDMYENPPAKEFCDYFVQINTTDKDKTLQEAIRYNICAILTDATDVAVPTVSYIAEKLNLNAISYEVAISCTNKYVMRKKLNRFKNNMPEYKYFSDFDLAKQYLTDNQKICIVKPTDSQGSKGVHLLDKCNDDKLKDAFSQSLDGDILVEEYINGEQYSLECLINDNIITLLIITKIDFFKNKNIAKKLSYFYNIKNEVKKMLMILNEKIIKELHINNCITHAEYRIQDNKPYLIEIACRGGGGGISTIAIPYLTNINIQEFLIMKAFDKKYTLNRLNSTKLMCIEFFEFNLGKIDGFYIDDEVDNIVYRFELDRNLKEIYEIMDSRDRYGFFVVIANTQKEIYDKIKKVYKYIKPNYIRNL